jgi:hypothetical protein
VPYSGFVTILMRRMINFGSSNWKEAVICLTPEMIIIVKEMQNRQKLIGQPSPHKPEDISPGLGTGRWRRTVTKWYRLQNRVCVYFSHRLYKKQPQITILRNYSLVDCWMKLRQHFSPQTKQVSNVRNNRDQNNDKRFRSYEVPNIR